jgi:hypothetical protein
VEAQLVTILSPWEKEEEVVDLVVMFSYQLYKCYKEK